MAIISQTELAELTGRTRQAIWQRIQRDTLVALSNGKLDTEDPINAKFIADVELDNNIEATIPDYDESLKPESKKNEDPLAKSAVDAKRGQDVLKYKKLELEVKELEGSLISRNLVADTCFDYLSALNINIMESPQSFLDELEGAIANNFTRAVKMRIVTKPICDAINLAVNQVEKTLKEKLV